MKWRQIDARGNTDKRDVWAWRRESMTARYGTVWYGADTTKDTKYTV